MHGSPAAGAEVGSNRCCAVLVEWAHGGVFSVGAEVHIEASDRTGPERLLRYRARRAFALERLREPDELDTQFQPAPDQEFDQRIAW